MTKQVVIAGGSGLVGRQVAAQLARYGYDVHAILRKRSDELAPAIKQHIGQGTEWPTIVSGLKPDVAISCLGTTMRAAGSRQAFRAVDHDLVLAFATATHEAGATHMIAISSVGAAAKSGNFYLRTKGQVESALADIGFDRLDIIRPGLLTGGSRPDSRLGESLAATIAPVTDLFMLGNLSRYRSTPSDKVAKAIAALVAENGQGNFIHENDSIMALAG
jgi:uncharacterized protein YbjT (DUF2867 family)